MSALSSATSTRPRPAPTGAAGCSGSSSGNQRSASATNGSTAAGPRSVEVGATRSDGRWSCPNGRRTRNVVPRCGALSTVIVPPCRPISSRTTASPIPLPSPDRAFARSTRWNRSNSRGTSSAGTPVPVSATVSTAARSCARRATVIRPSKVNLRALDSRLRTIFSHMSRSTYTGSGSGATSTT